MDWYGMHSWGMGGWMMLWWLFLIFVVAGSASLFYRQVGRSNGKTALDILKERYAKGEMSKKEFEEKKHDIS